MTPHLVSLAKRLEGRPFHLLATHRQNQPKESVVSYIRGKGLAASSPNMSVTSFGGHPQVKGNGSVPYYMVFDHTGRLVQHHMCGDYHGGDGLAMIEWVDKLLAETPEIWAGEAPFDTHAELAARVTAKKGFPGSIAELESAMASGDDAELTRLHGALVRWRDAGLARADSLLARTPADAVPHLKALAKETKDTELGAPIAERLTALDGSAEQKRAVGVAKSLDKLEARLGKLDACKPCRRAGEKALRADCPTCRDDNGKALASTRKKLDDLLGEAQGLPIEAAVRTLRESLGD